MKQANSVVRKSLYNKYFAFITAGLLLSGCAALHQPGGFSDEELKLSQYATLTSVDAIQNLEKSYRSSEKQELNVYAPKHYATAGKALTEAKSLISRNASRDEIVHKVAVGQAVLRNADRVMSKVKETLSDELELKNKLDSMDTPNIYGTEYGSLVDRLNKVIQSMETGTAPANENREKLIKDMQQLEQKARRYNAMHEPEEILKRVKYRGGETLAPITYNEALEVFKHADEFIRNNPTYETGIEQIGKEALFAAKRALYVTEQVAALSQKFNLSPEQIILDEEYRLFRVARELTNEDWRDHPLEVQSEMLAKTAVAHTDEIKNKEDLIIALRDTLIEVRDSSANLAALSETTKQLRVEKGQWLAKEALYKAKVDSLQSKLDDALAQLDKTQQKVLKIQNANEALSKNLEQSKKEVVKLNNEISTQKAVTTAQTKSNEKADAKPKEVANKKSESAITQQSDSKEIAQSKNEPPKEKAANHATDEDRVKVAEKAKKSATDANKTDKKQKEDKVNIASTSTNTKSAAQQETLKSLQSAKELIKILRANKSEDTKTASSKKPPTKNTDKDDDTFVDASE